MKKRMIADQPLPILHIAIVFLVLMFVFIMNSTYSSLSRIDTNETMPSIKAGFNNYTRLETIILSILIIITIINAYLVSIHWERLGRLTTFILTMSPIFLLLILLVSLITTTTAVSAITSALVTGNQTLLDNTINSLYTSSIKLMKITRTIAVVMLVAEMLGTILAVYEVLAYRRQHRY